MAISVDTITGQDSPNSGRQKVNTNFSTVVSEINTHGTLLGALQGGVADLNSPQTFTNKSLTSSTAGGSNIMTISHNDIYDNYFGITNAYPGISVGDQKTTFINKTTTGNSLLISGWGGFTPEIDTATNTIKMGFPQAAYLNYPGGTQSLVINNDTRLGTAVLDVDGGAVVRSKLEVGDSAAGAFSADDLTVRVGAGAGVTADATLGIHTAASTGNSQLNFKLDAGVSNTPSGRILGAINFRGKAGGNFSELSSGTRIQVASTETYTGSTQQGAEMQFLTIPDGANVASFRMVIKEDGKVGIGEIGPLGTLHVKTADCANSNINAGGGTAVFEDLNGVGITLKTNGANAGSIFFADNDDDAGILHYTHASDMFAFGHAGSFKTTINNSGYIKIASDAASTEALEVLGSAGSPLTAKADIFSTGNSLTSHPSVDGAFYKYSDGEPYMAFQTNMHFRDYDAGKDILTLKGAASDTKVGINTNAPASALHVKQDTSDTNKGIRIENPSGSATANFWVGTNHAVWESSGKLEIRPNGTDNAFSLTTVADYTNWPEDASVYPADDDADQRLAGGITGNTDTNGATPGTYAKLALNRDANSLDSSQNYPFSLQLFGPGSQFWNLGEGMSLTEQNNYYGGNNDARLLSLHDTNGANGVVDGGFTIQGFTTTDKKFVPIAHFKSTVTGAKLGIGDMKNPAKTLEVAGDAKIHSHMDVLGNVHSLGNLTGAGLTLTGGSDVEINDVNVEILESANTNTTTETGFRITGDRGTYDAARHAVLVQKYQGSQSTSPHLRLGFKNGSVAHTGIVDIYSKSAVKVPVGSTSYRPGTDADTEPELGMIRYNSTVNGQYPAGYYESYQRLGNSSSGWVHISTPPVGSCYIQFPGTPAPSTLYPNTTWSQNSSDTGIPTNSFIRNKGEDATSDTAWGASPFGDGSQIASLVQHEHKIHRPRDGGDTQFDRAHNGDSDPMQFERLYDDSGEPIFTGTDISSVAASKNVSGDENRPYNVTVIFFRRVI